jgi:ATP:ADP antiporter, AAA family
VELTQYLKSFLLRTFDVREGEYRRVFLMQLNIFLIIFTLLIIKPVVNAQFISVIGIDQLPIVFVLVAICAMVVSTLYSKALNTKSLQKVTTITLVVSIVLLVAFGLLLHFNFVEDLVLYALYIGVAIFGVLATSQFWIMANLAFDAREAKRLFSFIGAGPIVGGVAGGYVASLIASYIEGTNLLFLGAALLCFCIPLNNTIWKNHIKTLTVFQKKKRFTDFGDHPIWLIRKSKHLTYLALVIGLSVLVSKLVEFQFSSVASANFSDPDELTSFFGFWFSTFNVVSLIVQLFLTKRIVGIFGVGSSLFALPSGVFLGSLFLLFSPVLWAGIFTKLWEVSIKQSVNKSATELLSLPIPLAIKSQTKSFIDVFVDLAATGVAGLFLMFLVNGLDLSVQSVSILTILILGIWAWLAIKVRQEYINSFKSKLSQADKESIKPLPDFNNVSVLEGLKRALQSGSESQILYVLKKVGEIPDKRLFDDVVKFLDHPSEKVRIMALKCIYYLQKTVAVDTLEHLLNDPEMEVRYKAFSQLLRQTKEQRITTINRYLLHSDPKISGAALVGLAEEARNNPEMKRMLKIEQRIYDKLDYLNLVDSEEEKYLYRVMVLRAIGQANIQSLHSEIERSLYDEDKRIVKEAILAAGLTMNADFVSKIIPFLEFKETRVVAQDALLYYGEGIINELLLIAKTDTTRIDLVAHLPSVLERIDSAAAVKALFSFLDTPDVMLRLEALRSINTMQRDFPHLKIKKEDIVSRVIDESNLYKNMLGVLYKERQMLTEAPSEAIQSARANLIDIIERRLDGTLERIFRLIGLRYPPEDVITAYNGIKSINEHIRLNSVEFLDNLLEPSLKKTLVPIAENAIFEVISTETIDQLKVKILDESGCLKMLLEGRDPKLKMAVFRLILALENKAYIPMIQPLTLSPNEKVRRQAEKVIEELMVG